MTPGPGRERPHQSEPLQPSSRTELPSATSSEEGPGVPGRVSLPWDWPWLPEPWPAGHGPLGSSPRRPPAGGRAIRCGLVSRCESTTPTPSPPALAGSQPREMRDTSVTRHVRCHQEIAQTYAKHSMGRSLTPLSEFRREGFVPSGGQASIEWAGFRFTVESKDGRMTHGESLEDGAGQVLFRNEEEARYVVGSGQQGVSFLIERGDGYLFSSPLSWYPRERGWDLAPGFKNKPAFREANPPGCIYCHANQPSSSKARRTTIGRLSSGVMRSAASGATGPARTTLRGADGRVGGQPNIVNPASLEPHLREGVCQQCHLQAEVRILRAGRSWTDYRPGSPLHEYIDVYLREGHRLGNRFVGQVEQMYASRCFQGSQARSVASLATTRTSSPPRPSATPSIAAAAWPATRATPGGLGRGDDPPEASPRRAGPSDAAPSGPACAVPRPERLKRNPADSCIDCHMPRTANQRIAHTATSNHQIPRRPEGHREPDAERTRAARAGSRKSFLVSFFQKLREQDRASGREPETDTGRDLGVALSVEPPDPSSREPGPTISPEPISLPSRSWIDRSPGSRRPRSLGGQGPGAGTTGAGSRGTCVVSGGAGTGSRE